MSDHRTAREAWVCCAIPALTNASFDKVHDFVEAQLRADLDARAELASDPRDVIGDGITTTVRSWADVVQHGPTASIPWDPASDGDGLEIEEPLDQDDSRPHAMTSHAPDELGGES